ncbi:MAG: cell wall hydrolase [Lachnospiraceae bacterium]|nr:cell wall hydrolase [Lachnospiraceae bacterium]
MHKAIVHHFALAIALVLTLVITLGFCVTTGTAQVLTLPDNIEIIESDEVVSDKIIQNVQNYLSLTSCENIESAPEILGTAERTPRMIIEISDEDIYLLACQVYCEARGEPYEGMVGVANVIINRVISDYFPDTVPEVLYQRGQFPPATNGSLDRAVANGPGEECMQAALDALYGVSYAGDYLYFNMKQGVSLSKCSSYLQIGNTIFYTPKQ